jgi:hypothetical protein
MSEVDGLAPTISELSRGFGVLLPASYARLWSIAFQLSPDDPANAFEPIGIQCLGLKERIEESYDTPPEFFTFGWTGVDSSRYGFVVDDPNHPVDEYPIAHSEPESQLEASTLPEFLERCIATELEPLGPVGLIIDIPGRGACPPTQPSPDPRALAREKERTATIRQIWAALQPAFGLTECEDPDETLERAWSDRLSAGAVPTVDKLGAMVPEDTVDREYLDSLQWTSDDSWRRLPPNESRLTEAERRLASGQAGTALVIARNFRFLHWHDDWKSGRNYIRRTAEIMSRAYRELSRDFLADRVNCQTDVVLTNVL